MLLSIGFLATIFLTGCIECFGKKCYLTSCSCNGGMKWSLPKQEANECLEIVVGGHTSCCPNKDTVMLFDTPFVTSGSNKSPQATKIENVMPSANQSCETNGKTWVNRYCTLRCTCYENKWACSFYYGCSLNATCTVSEGVGQCVCKPGYTGDGDTCKPFYKDCDDAYGDGHNQTGVYTILPDEWPDTPFNVSCDMTTSGRGWIIFQRRVDGMTNFFRNWTSYKMGFGSLRDGKDFWLGNEKLFYLTNQGVYKLGIDIVAANGEPIYEEYEEFRIENESSNYQIMELEKEGGLTGAHGLYGAAGGFFSTLDRDNDKCEFFNCAEKHRGAWWYTNNWCKPCWKPQPYCDDFVINDTCHSLCTYSNLNGDYKGMNGENINWHISSNCNTRSSQMKISRKL